MQKILIATTNRGKLTEIFSLLQHESLHLVTPTDIGLDLDVAEIGSTYADNAALKARAYAQASGLVTLADDSGLELDCLGGEPGLRSARYAPQPGATDADRRTYLLGKLSTFPRPWTAHFCCLVAVVFENGATSWAQGACEGEIIPVERGSNGFGYDPIFYIPILQKTMAELTLTEKNQVSHRSRAIKAMLPELKRLVERF